MANFLGLRCLGEGTFRKYLVIFIVVCAGAMVVYTSGVCEYLSIVNMPVMTDPRQYKGNLFKSIMMTSWHGNIFALLALCEEIYGLLFEFPLERANIAGLGISFVISVNIFQATSRYSVYMRRHGTNVTSLWSINFQIYPNGVKYYLPTFLSF